MIRFLLMARVLKTPADGDHEFSDFIVYVDESGDHGLVSLDPDYPVFVPAFCVFDKLRYCGQALPALHKIKFSHFGHDVVILHEHDIRKEKGPFKFKNRDSKRAFLHELTDIITATDFNLISCVIDKSALNEEGRSNNNPYHIALSACLESLMDFMQQVGQATRHTHIVVECRGRKEDDELELEFRRICAGANSLNRPLPFELIFADKKVNSPGLQLADLVARPIGLSVLRPQQDNRAFNVLRTKFFSAESRRAPAGPILLPAKKRKAPMNLIEATTPTGFSQST